MPPHKTRTTLPRRGPGRPRRTVECNDGPEPHLPPFAFPRPRPPIAPLLPFKRFSNEWWSKIQDEHPKLDCFGVNNIICAKWYELPTAVRQEYIDDFIADMWQYKKSMALYEEALQACKQAEAETINVLKEVMDYGAPKPRKFLYMDEKTDGAEQVFRTQQLSMARIMMNNHIMTQIFFTSMNAVPTPMYLDMLTYQLKVLEDQIKVEKLKLVQWEKNHKAKMERIMKAEAEFNEQANCWTTFMVGADGTTEDLGVGEINAEPISIGEIYADIFKKGSLVPLEPCFDPPYCMEYDEGEPVVLLEL